MTNEAWGVDSKITEIVGAEDLWLKCEKQCGCVSDTERRETARGSGIYPAYVKNGKVQLCD